MTGHTPGPWKASYSIAGPIATVVDSSENVLCEMVVPAEGLAASDTNARLIAAAPDLLEILEEIAFQSRSPLWHGVGGSVDDETMDRLRTAIAKARGA